MADLNALIAQGAQFKAPPDPFAQYAQMQTMQQNEQANQLGQMKMQEYQRGLASQNALRASPVPEGVNPQHWAIDPAKALEFAKSAEESIYKKAQTGHLNAQSNELTIKALGSTFDNFTKMNPPTTASTSPEGITAYITNLYRDPLLGAVAAKQMPLDAAIQMNLTEAAKDPKAWATAHLGLTGDKLFESMKGTRQNTNLGGVNQGQTIDVYGRPVAGSVVNTKTTATPGELLANQAAVERNRIAQDVLTQGKVPTGYRAGAGGGVEPIPGGPASGDKSLTESQGNATAYGMRMHEANKTLNDLEKLGEKNTGVISGAVGGLAGMIPLIGDKLQGATGSLFNALPEIMGGLSPEQQQVAQARINFITAQLRKESGASIAPSEFITAEKMYFPKPGDTQAVIDAKSKTRKTAIEAMKVQAGPGAKHIGSMAGTAPSTDPLGLR